VAKHQKGGGPVRAEGKKKKVQKNQVTVGKTGGHRFFPGRGGEMKITKHGEGEGATNRKPASIKTLGGGGGKARPFPAYQDSHRGSPESKEETNRNRGLEEDFK